MPASEKPNPNGFGFSVSFAGKALYLRSQRQTAYQYGAQYPHPAAADARSRSGHRHRQRDRLFRPPHQQAAAVVLARTVGRRDDLRLVRRVVPAGADNSFGGVGRAYGDNRHRGQLLRGHPAHRRHRPAGSLVREPPRGPHGRGDGQTTPQPQTDAHGHDDGTGHRHPQLPGRYRHLHVGRGQHGAGRGNRRGDRHPQHSRRHCGLDSDLLRHGRPQKGVQTLAAVGGGAAAGGPTGPVRQGSPSRSAHCWPIWC